jgi:hypothetical protein
MSLVAGRDMERRVPDASPHQIGNLVCAGPDWDILLFRLPPVKSRLTVVQLPKRRPEPVCDTKRQKPNCRSVNFRKIDGFSELGVGGFATGNDSSPFA